MGGVGVSLCVPVRDFLLAAFSKGVAGRRVDVVRCTGRPTCGKTPTRQRICSWAKRLTQLCLLFEVAHHGWSASRQGINHQSQGEPQSYVNHFLCALVCDNLSHGLHTMRPPQSFCCWRCCFARCHNCLLHTLLCTMRAVASFPCELFV